MRMRDLELLRPGVCFIRRSDCLIKSDTPVYVFQEMNSRSNDMSIKNMGLVNMRVTIFGTRSQFYGMEIGKKWPSDIDPYFELFNMDFDIYDLEIIGEIDLNVYQEAIAVEDLINGIHIAVDYLKEKGFKPKPKHKHSSLIFSKVSRDKEIDTHIKCYNEKLKITKIIKTSHSYQESYSYHDEHEFIRVSFAICRSLQNGVHYSDNRAEINSYTEWRKTMDKIYKDGIINNLRNATTFIRVYRCMSLKDTADLYQISIKDTKYIASEIISKYKLSKEEALEMFKKENA